MRPLLCGTDFNDDVKQAQHLLSEEKWLFEEFQVLDRKKEEHWGLAFALPAWLKILGECGYLTQFDSTHKVNKWRHNMFSFLARDEHGMWIPAAHCVVDCEESEVICKALCVCVNQSIAIPLPLRTARPFIPPLTNSCPHLTERQTGAPQNTKTKSKNKKHKHKLPC